MIITDITIERFRTWSDRYQNGEALPKTEIIQTLATVHTARDVVGRYSGGHGHGAQEGLDQGSIEIILGRVRPLLIEMDPYDRERIWQWLWTAKTPEHVIGVIDMALW